ncbi:SIR2 family protein [Cytophaga sp. FL35]|uniref:SIR2 family protein n=1 Tax=Cytophaga sp. FL35 TaxID=1904456 RepID=UPI0016537972|nr:SIR2 family protein [Cytophaga sp. FL35]MBC6998343.1 SIR2 family protein [Cytophaga sp. FL35]
MAIEHKHDPLRELSEIRNQLSYSKRLGFLFGAGTSKAIGISDIAELTTKIEKQLKTPEKEKFLIIKKGLDADSQHIEAILNQIRLIRQITADSKSKSFEKVSGEDAKKLDKKICNIIYDIISDEESKADINVVKRFVGWLNWLSRDYPKELFTTNYDLVLEKSAESLLIPFYDGFIGANEPFFASESLESSSKYDSPPISWIRLWKLHGSLGWFWKENKDGKSHRVVRLTSGAKEKFPNAELVIYPSKDKYESSRKQPFISYFDRLKSFLIEGEGIFIISGYSFSDEHLNEVIFNALNQNNRIQIIAFFYTDDPLDKIVKEGKNFPNLTLLGPSAASISGTYGKWKIGKMEELLEPFWEKTKGNITLGDFNQLVEFLIFCSGMKDKTTDS